MRSARELPLLPVLAFAVLLFTLAYHLRATLIPFVLSFALAYLVNPIVNLFESRGLRRDQIVLTMYLVLAAVISIGANFLLPTVTEELTRLQSKIPLYVLKSKETFAALQHGIAAKLPIGQKLVEHLSLKMYEPVMLHVQQIPSYVLGLLPLLSLLFLVPFITFFFLMDGTKAINQAIQVCPSRHVEQILHLVAEIDTSLGNYVRGVLIVALAISVASFVGLVALGVDYALAIATLSGVSSFVPYAGAVIGAAVGGVVAWYQFGEVMAAVKVILLFFGIRLADEALVQPLVSKHSVHLHPMVFLLALMVGGHAFGFIGLLFAVPAACILKALLALIWDWYLSESGGAGPAVPEARIPYV